MQLLFENKKGQKLKMSFNRERSNVGKVLFLHQPTIQRTQVLELSLSVPLVSNGQSNVSDFSEDIKATTFTQTMKRKTSERPNVEPNKLMLRAGALVQWLWEETRILKVVGLNPGTIYWIGIFSHLFVLKIVIVCLKRRK